MPDAVDGHGGFGDVRGHNNLAKYIRREGKVLFLRLKFPVQGDEGEPLAGMKGATGVDGGIDFAHARHEDQNVAFRAGIDDAFHDLRGLFHHRALVVRIKVTGFDRECSARKSGWGSACRRRREKDLRPVRRPAWRT